jgi:O-antigen/teichoic acid export membrane protein
VQALNYKSLRLLTPRALHPWRDRLEASPLATRLAGGVFWSACGTALSRALALLVSIVTARILGKEMFGELGIVQSTILMFGTFAAIGMGLTATKHVAQYRFTDTAHAGRIIGMSSVVSWVSGLGMALAVAALAPWIAVHTLAAPQLTGALRLGALCLLFNVVNDAQLGALSGFEAFRRRSVIQFTGGLVTFPIAIAGVYWWGLMGAIWGLALSGAILVFLNFLGLRREARLSGISISWRISSQEFKVLWEFSLPTILGSAVYVPAMWLANTIIVNQPHGYAEMGVFSAADRWRMAIMFFPSMLGGVTLPMLSSLRAGADSRKYFKLLWSSVGLSSLCSLLVAALVAALAPWIMAGYGAGFAIGKGVLVLLCAVAVIAATSWIIGQSIVSEGRMWFMLILNLIWGSVLVGCAWCLRSQGAMALALGYLFAEGVRLAIALADARMRHTRQLRSA